MQRLPSKSGSFVDRIALEKQRLEAEIAQAEPGRALNALKQKLRQLDVAAHVDEWLSSPGLQSPR
jgi:hypothetical protein